MEKEKNGAYNIAAEGTVPQGVHKKADETGGADADHLNKGHQDGDYGRGQGTKGKSGNADDHILKIKIQEHNAGHQLGQKHHDVGDGGEHGHAHHYSGVHTGGAGARTRGDRFRHKKHSLFVLVHLKSPCLPGAKTIKEVRAHAEPRVNCFTHIFFHPDYTVGPGISPGQRVQNDEPGRGLYRQWGISPRPEDIAFSCPYPLYVSVG